MGRLQCGDPQYWYYADFELDPGYNEPTVFCGGAGKWHRAYYNEVSRPSVLICMVDANAFRPLVVAEEGEVGQGGKDRGGEGSGTHRDGFLCLVLVWWYFEAGGSRHSAESLCALLPERLSAYLS